LRIKEEETCLTLQEHDDDEINSSVIGVKVKDDIAVIAPQPVRKFLVYILLLFLISVTLCPQQKVFYV
jgi:hypothetical protein